MIRDYEPRDLETIKAIHESTQIDYTMPDLNSPLFLVTKVLEQDGVVRAALGAYIQVELYLWLDHTDWATPEQKHQVLIDLDKEVMKDTWLKGVNCACLWLPPGMERFGERLVEDFNFTKDRDGWVSYSKDTGAKSEDRS